MWWLLSSENANLCESLFIETEYVPKGLSALQRHIKFNAPLWISIICTILWKLSERSLWFIIHSSCLAELRSFVKFMTFNVSSKDISFLTVDIKSHEIHISIWLNRNYINHLQFPENESWTEQEYESIPWTKALCLSAIDCFVLQGHDMDGSAEHVTKYYVPLPNKSDCNDSYCVNLRFLCGDGSCGMFSGTRRLW